MSKATYYLNSGPNGRYVEVTMEEFVAAESAAGFHPKPGTPIGRPATGGFSGANGVNGKVFYTLSMGSKFKETEVKK
jgi:hypothetical protein